MSGESSGGAAPRPDGAKHAHSPHAITVFLFFFAMTIFKKLVLDLDETLVFSSMDPIGPDSIALDAGGTRFFTMLRPGTREFLNFAKQKFEVTVWSTGMQSYVESVCRHIGAQGITLWGREHCKKIESCADGEPYEKPLRQITEDLTQIVIVDNTPTMFAKCPLNGIAIRTWRGDPDDAELEHLSFYLEWLAAQNSVQRNHQSWRIETLCMRAD